MTAELPADGGWLMDDDVNLFDSLACLLDDGVDNSGMDTNEIMSDLESCGPSVRGTGVKLEKGGKGAKKRKFNPDSDVIAAATDETLKQLDIDPNSKEGKAKRRQIRNRLSAQFHRDRKNAHLNTMEQQLAAKDMEIASLKEQVKSLLAENEYLRKLHPGFVGARPHAASLSSYPSTIQTDSEGTTGVDAVYFLGRSAPPLASNMSSLTVSPNESPQHVAVEAHLPGIPHINLTMPMPMPVVGNTVKPPTGRANGTVGAGAGPGVLQVPSGFARPLSIITMVCMVSIMLLSGSQSPTISGVTLQHSTYEQQQAAQRALYVQSLASGGPHADLTVGSELLALMSAEAGKHHVETRQTVAVDLPVHEDEQAGQAGRRLSAIKEEADESEGSADDASTEASQASKRQRRVALGQEQGNESPSGSPSSGRSRSNSLHDPSLMSSDDEASATRAISTLKLVEDTAVAVRSLQNTSAQPPMSAAHQHLRRAPAATGAYTGQQNASRQHQTVRNVARQVIYSAGVVSRGLVEDSAPYARGSRVFAAHTRDGVNATVDTDMGEDHDHEGYPGPGEPTFGSAGDYHWPASQAFDYAVQSYSKVVLTEGQALLDPSLALHKNPFAWTRALFRNSAGAYQHHDDHDQESTVREPTIVERDQEGYVDDAEMHDGARASDSGVGALTTMSAVPMRMLSAPAGAAPVTDASSSSPSNAVVPLAAVKQEAGYAAATQNLHLPAVVHRASYESEFDEQPASERVVLNKLLGESNFLTLKLPASSIRVGKSWSDSKSGTVESIMEVLNISGETSADGNGNSTFGPSASTDASVEINCIILGAKLVLSETASA